MEYNKRVNTFDTVDESAAYLVHGGAEAPNVAYIRGGDVICRKNVEFEIKPTWYLYGVTDSPTDMPERRNSYVSIVSDLGGGYYLYAGSGRTNLPDLSGCTSLISAAIGSGVTFIEGEFWLCSRLTKVVIPDSVTKIGDSSFRGCTSLKDINIPDSVKNIGTYAFNNCHSLDSIDIPSSVTSIGNNAFEGCILIKGMKIPSGVKIIESYTFSNCSGLTSVVIPDSVEDIGTYAFNNCHSLESIDIPSSVKYLRDNAFRYCDKIGEIKVPDSVETIGSYTFSTMTSLKYMSIGVGIKSIGGNAFYGHNPQTVYVIKAETPPTIEENMFNYRTQKVYVPDSSFEAYAAATNWSNVHYLGQLCRLSQLKIDYPDYPTHLL